MVDTAKLKSIMVLCGFTQKTLATEMNIGVTSLNEKINNKQVFRCDEVDKICEVLQITDAEEMRSIFFAQSIPQMG